MRNLFLPARRRDPISVPVGASFARSTCVQIPTETSFMKLSWDNELQLGMLLTVKHKCNATQSLGLPCFHALRTTTALQMIRTVHYPEKTRSYSCINMSHGCFATVKDQSLVFVATTFRRVCCPDSLRSTLLQAPQRGSLNNKVAQSQLLPHSLQLQLSCPRVKGEGASLMKRSYQEDKRNEPSLPTSVIAVG